MPLRARRARVAGAIGGLAALILACLACLACRAPRPCAAVPSTTVQPAPRRDYCLAPPWVLDPARPESGVAGWSAAACTDGPGWFRDAADRARRSAYFIHDGARAITDAEITAVHAELRGMGVSYGLGGCCSPKVAKETQVLCLKFSLQEVCRLPLSRIVKAVDDALRETKLETVRVGVDVMVGGTVGPRCEATDSACGPVSSRDWDQQDVRAPKPPACMAGRVRVPEATIATPGAACAHDGECLVGACGEKCLRWDQPLGPTSCEERGDIEERPVTYCGCVAGRCDWFRPAAP